jgi:hypothetical protein
MECPLCAALNREHNQECETEASATLKRRADLLSRSPGDISMQDQLDQEVLRSRKRQAHIAFELHRHRTSQHPGLTVAKTASA